MKKLLFVSLFLLALGHQARAQLVQVVNAGVSLLGIAKNASPLTPVVTLEQYGSRTYPVQRTSAAGRGILGGDQITYLERQLDQCRARLRADSTGSVCTAAQLQQLQATQAAIATVQRKWPLQPYAEEIAFYTAEEARRKPAAAAVPTPGK